MRFILFVLLVFIVPNLEAQGNAQRAAGAQTPAQGPKLSGKVLDSSGAVMTRMRLTGDR